MVRGDDGLTVLAAEQDATLAHADGRPLLAGPRGGLEQRHVPRLQAQHCGRHKAVVHAALGVKLDHLPGQRVSLRAQLQSGACWLMNMGAKQASSDCNGCCDPQAFCIAQPKLVMTERDNPVL